jgi:hypothetical protein
VSLQVDKKKWGSDKTSDTAHGQKEKKILGKKRGREGRE